MTDLSWDESTGLVFGLGVAMTLVVLTSAYGCLVGVRRCTDSSAFGSKRRPTVPSSDRTAEESNNTINANPSSSPSSPPSSTSSPPLRPEPNGIAARSGRGRFRRNRERKHTKDQDNNVAFSFDEEDASSISSHDGSLFYRPYALKEGRNYPVTANQLVFEFARDERAREESGQYPLEEYLDQQQHRRHDQLDRTASLPFPLSTTPAQSMAWSSLYSSDYQHNQDPIDPALPSDDSSRTDDIRITENETKPSLYHMHGIAKCWSMLVGSVAPKDPQDCPETFANETASRDCIV